MFSIAPRCPGAGILTWQLSYTPARLFTRHQEGTRVQGWGRWARLSSSHLVSHRLTSSHLVIAPFCVSFSGASWRTRGGNWIKIENVSRALLHSPRLCREPLGDTSRGHLTIVCMGHYNNCRHLPAAGAGAARGENRLLQILKDIIWQNLMALGFRASKEGNFVVSVRSLFVQFRLYFTTKIKSSVNYSWKYIDRDIKKLQLSTSYWITIM